MFSSLLVCLLAILINFTSSFLIPPSSLHRNGQLSRRAGRAVWVLSDTMPQTLYTFEDGSTGFQVHSSIWIAGDAANGPLKSEIAINFDVTPMFPEYGLHLRILDQGTDSSGKEPPMKAGREKFGVGETDLQNSDLFNFDAREGLLIDNFFDDNNYRSGEDFKGNINDCNTFVKKMLTALNIDLPEDNPLMQMLEGSEKWHSRPGSTKLDVEVKAVAYLDSEHPVQILRTDATDPHPVDLTPDGESTTTAFQNDLVLEPEFRQALPADELSLASSDDLIMFPGGGDLEVVETTSTLARVEGTLNTLTAISKDALTALGVVGTLVGAAFVILDFVDHNWVGGAIGTVGLAAGVAAGFLISGPLGWIVGGAIAALFAILPGLFSKTNPAAKVTDVQGILQWTMFGDSTHTGNEQCQKGTADSPGNPNCTALYGAGTLSTVLGLNNFDSIVFLQQYNDGYAISIKDMAAAWYVIDPTKPGDGGDKIATINCNNKGGTSAGRAGIIGGDDFALCNHPTYAINRPLITLPHLNATADKIYDRIIPAPNGDCKLIAFPGTQSYPTYNLTVTGLPSAIACGLTAAINVNGVAVPIQGDTNSQSPQTGSSASQSTSGQGGAFVAPPPAAPFAALDPENYVCLSYQDASLCLPPGVYQKQTGLGFEIKKTDTLTLPPGGFELAAHWKDAPEFRDPFPQGFTTNNYTANQSPPASSKTYYSFAADMKAIDQNRDSLATFTISGPNTGPDPICCLYSATSLGGDAICLGVGGGDIPPQWQKMAQSVNCFNGAQMWIYANEYADAGGALISKEVDDLTDEPYGGTGNFLKKTKAVWISESKI